ncbi:MAG: fatty-acid oxidation protein subunit alpha [Okeania sp. SIO3C4]|nr:fatty-acid oxidation protein subunit alpha [Okeania sp. SIO3B3]NER07544.1 fatty-acid oxidation protein subunit alpha [Okeania sp. SIO3C4]
MPAKDFFHNAVKSALIKDGWKITDDPLFIKSSTKISLYIDIGGERVIGAEKDGRKIAVEIKSFLSMSPLAEFHTALGQFLNYMLAFKLNQPERILYLAITKDAYRDFFSDSFIQLSVSTYQVKLLIFDPLEEVIVLWKN